jgi:hypothetical protein
MMKRKRNIISLLSVIIIMSCSFPVSAYKLEDDRHTVKCNPNKAVYYQYIGNNSIAKNAFAVAANEWTKDTDANIKAHVNPTLVCSDIYATAADWDALSDSERDDWNHKFDVSVSYDSEIGEDGLSVWWRNDHNVVSKAHIYLNRAQSKTWNDTGALQSVAVHEFGHILGLADMYDGSKCIMNAYTWGDNSRYGTYRLTKPQDDDIDGVQSLY